MSRLFTDMNKEGVRKVIAWCKDHDWCEYVSYNESDGVLTIIPKDKLEGNELKFTSFRSIKQWAGY